MPKRQLTFAGPSLATRRKVSLFYQVALLLPLLAGICAFAAQDTPTPTGSVTSTVSPPPTRSPTASQTNTRASTRSATASPSDTHTLTRSASLSGTHTNSHSASLSGTHTNSHSTTLTNSLSATRSQSYSVSHSTSLTLSVTFSSSISVSSSLTLTATSSESDSSTISLLNVALPGNWRQLSQTVDSVESAAAVCEGSTITLFGGRNAIGRISESMFTFAPGRGWTEVAFSGPIPGLYGHQMAAVGGSYFLFGGTLASGSISDELWRYDKQRSRWLEVFNQGDRPLGRTMYQMVPIPERGTFLLLFGRTAKLLDTDIWEYNTTSNEWTLLDPLTEDDRFKPLPRFSTCCSYDNSTRAVFCFGGTTPEGDSGELWTLRWTGSEASGSFTWARIEALKGPSPRRAAQCAVFNGSFLVTGGRETEVSGTTVANDDLYVFHIANMSWRVVQHQDIADTATHTQELGRRSPTRTPSHGYGQKETTQVSMSPTHTATQGHERLRAHTRTYTLMVAPLAQRTKTVSHTRTGTAISSITHPNRSATVTLTPSTADDPTTSEQPHTFVPSSDPDPTTIPTPTSPPLPPAPFPTSPVFTPVDPPLAEAVLEPQLSFRGEPRESGVMCATDHGVLIQGGLRDDEILNDLKLLGSDWKWQTLSESRPSPGKRADHTAFMVATDMYVAFGRDKVGTLSDIWAFDTISERWVQKRPLNPPRGRYGCSASVVGQLVYFFGGLLSISDPFSFTNDFWQYDVSREVFKLITAPAQPPARAYHQAVAFGGDLLVLFGSTDLELYATDAYVFVALSGRWVPVDFTGSTGSPAGRMRFGISADPAGVVVYGGVSRRPLADRWLISRPVVAGEIATVRAVQIISNFSEGEQSRPFSRGGAAVAGVGNRAVICGGVISEGVPPTTAEACYQHERTTGLNNRMMPSPTQTVSSSGSYFGRSFYMFGGLLTENSVVRNDVFLNALQIYQFFPESICEFSNVSEFRDRGCMYCSQGASASDCEPAPAGTFRLVPFGPVVPCPPGTFMPATLRGAQSSEFCRFCPEGTYSGTPGSLSCTPCPRGTHCPIGSTRVAGAIVAAEDVANTDSIPPIFSPLVVPYSVWTVFGVAGALMIFGIVFVVVLRRHAMQKQVTWYLLPEHNLLLRRLYREFYVAGNGLRLIDLQNILADSRLVMLKPLPISKVEELFCKHDETGSIALSFSEFRFLIFELIDEGFMNPFPGTLRDTNGMRTDALSWFFRSISFKKIDKYYAHHRIGDMGDPIRLQRNSNGGVLTIVFYLAFILLVVALLVTFTYDNMNETRSSMPNTLVRESFAGTIEVTFEITGSSDPSVCIERPGVCREEVSVVATSVSVGSEELTCQFSEPLQCQVVWRCFGCSMAHSQARIDLQLTDPRAFASMVRVTSSVSTGIHDLETPTSKPFERMAIARWEITPPPGRLLKGFPGSQITGRITQTVFRSPRNSWDQAERRNTGHHLQSADAATQVGQTVTEADFGNFFGVPITLALELAPTSLIVVRTARQTIPQFFTGLVGAMSGLSGGILTLLVFIDGRSGPKKEKKTVGEEERVFEGPGASGSFRASSTNVPVDEEPTMEAADLDRMNPRALSLGTLSETEREMVSALVKNGISIFAAIEIVRMMEAVSANAAAGGTTRRRTSGWVESTEREDEKTLEVRSCSSADDSNIEPRKDKDAGHQCAGNVSEATGSGTAAAGGSERPASASHKCVPNEAPHGHQLERNALAEGSSENCASPVSNSTVSSPPDPMGANNRPDEGSQMSVEVAPLTSRAPRSQSSVSSQHEAESAAATPREVAAERSKSSMRNEEVERRVAARRRASEAERKKLREKRERDRSRRGSSVANSADDSELDHTYSESSDVDGGAGHTEKDGAKNDKLSTSNPLVPPEDATLPDDEETTVA